PLLLLPSFMVTSEIGCHGPRRGTNTLWAGSFRREPVARAGLPDLNSPRRAAPKARTVAVPRRKTSAGIFRCRPVRLTRRRIPWKTKSDFARKPRADSSRENAFFRRASTGRADVHAGDQDRRRQVCRGFAVHFAMQIAGAK